MMDEPMGLKVAKLDIEIYMGEAAILLQKKDQIELTANRQNIEKMLHIKNWLSFLGIVLERVHIAPLDKLLVPDAMKELKTELFFLRRYVSDEIKIGNRDWRFYLGSCIERFGRYDKVKLKSKDSFLGSTLYMPSILNSVGIEVSEECKNIENGRIRIQNQKEKITNEEGVCYEAQVNTIVLKKGEELKEQEEIQICTPNFVFSIDYKNLAEVFNEKPDFEKFKLIGKLAMPSETIENYENKSKGRHEQLVIYKLNLSKIPTLFMYTSH